MLKKHNEKARLALSECILYFQCWPQHYPPSRVLFGNVTLPLPSSRGRFYLFFLAYWTNIIRERWLESLFRLSLKRSATWNTSSWTPSVVLCKACIAMWRDPCGGKQRLPVDSPSWATTWQPAPHVNEEGYFGAHCCTSA